MKYDDSWMDKPEKVEAPTVDTRHLKCPYESTNPELPARQHRGFAATCREKAAKQSASASEHKSLLALAEKHDAVAEKLEESA